MERVKEGLVACPYCLMILAVWKARKGYTARCRFCGIRVLMPSDLRFTIERSQRLADAMKLASLRVNLDY